MDDSKRRLTKAERTSLERSVRWLAGQNDSRYPAGYRGEELLTIGGLARLYEEVDVARAAESVEAGAAALFRLRSGSPLSWESAPFEVQAWWDRRARLARDPKGVVGRRPAPRQNAAVQLTLDGFEA